jgi:SAM-dependent methyltransferase
MIKYVRGDVLDHPFEPGSFDAIVSVATLHHMDTALGLRRLANLVRPGGVVAVVGIGRPRVVEDLPWQIAGTIASRYHRVSKKLWDTQRVATSPHQPASQSNRSHRTARRNIPATHPVALLTHQAKTAERPISDAGGARP